MWLFSGLLNCRKRIIHRQIEQRRAKWCNKTAWVLVPSFSSSLPSQTLQSGFLSPSLPSPQFSSNYFCQQGELIAIKSKEYLSAFVLPDLPPSCWTLWKMSLFTYSHSWHHLSWISSDNLLHSFSFSLQALVSSWSIPCCHWRCHWSFLFLSLCTLSPGAFIHFNDFKCFLLAQGCPNLCPQARYLSWAPHLYSLLPTRYL